MTDTAYGMLLSFSDLYPTDAEERAFVHGFEFSGIYRQMRDGAIGTLEATTHVENRTIIERAAAAEGWDCDIKPSGTDGWDFVTLTKVKTAKQNPHGLRVVQS